MENAADMRTRKSGRVRRRRIRAEALETGLIIALAGLVLFKGLPVLAGIMLAIGEMMLALTRL